MIKTKGLTHLHLMVRDLQRSLKFYKEVFGLEERFWGSEELVFLNTPGAKDMIALHQAKDDDERCGQSGGLLHFGFELETKEDLDRAIKEIIAAGGTLEQRGEFMPGLPYAYVADPDGYQIEL